MRLNDLLINTLYRFTLGREEDSQRCYLAIPVSNVRVDYEEYYEISEDQLALYKTDLMAAREFASRCGRRQFDDRLMFMPGSDRGVAEPAPSTAQLLAAALAGGELEDYLFGDAHYRLETRSDNDDPQSVVEAFEQIVAHWRMSADPQLPEYFVASLTRILAHDTDRNQGIYITAEWLWRYRYCLADNARYGDLFDVDTTALGHALRQSLETGKTSLMADKRWAGAAWNSPDGLWSPLVRVARSVRDKLDGPDFVPGNA